MIIQVYESLNLKLKRTNVDNPWFVIGISYPGALSAWFRLKFPHMTCGSLASSGVVLAVYKLVRLQDLNTQLVEEKLASDAKALKAMFDATGVPSTIWIYAKMYLERAHIPLLKHAYFYVEVHGWSLWFTKILDLVPSFLKVHRWSPWFALCNAFTPQLTNLKVSAGPS
ncbi:putative dipeptidyl-peptidase II [Helianthus anomalus]